MRPVDFRLAWMTVVTIMVCAFGFITDSTRPPPRAEAAPAAYEISQISQSDTRAVQLVLKSFGYTIAVDGVYGPQTTRVVKSWQRSNGLLEDGIAGPVTQASLGLGATAKRGRQQQVTDTVPPPPQPIEHYDIWVRLAQCESGGNWSINTGNGYYGGLQFALSSWRAVGGSGYPHQHGADEQMLRAEALLDVQGWGAWPACARKLGLR